MSNIISFTGTLGKDASLANINNGGKVLKCTVANTTGFGENQKTHWFSVSLFGKRAEGKRVNYLKKGQTVFVAGELIPREYQHEGQTKISLDVIATTLDLVGRKQQSNPNEPPLSAYDDY